MNKKMRSQLEVAIAVSQALLSGEIFKVSGSEIDAVPVKTATKSAMKKQGFELKRGAKHVGLWWFYHSKTGWLEAKLYLTSSFKKTPKAAEKEDAEARKRITDGNIQRIRALLFIDLNEELSDWVSQYGCYCGHPACKRCADMRRSNELLSKTKEAA